MDSFWGGWNKHFNGDLAAKAYFDSLPLSEREETEKALDEKSEEEEKKEAEEGQNEPKS